MNSPSATVSGKIIVALDVASRKDALALVAKLSGSISFFKVGLQLFISAGPEIVRDIAATGARVFLDLKVHDIPNTAARAVASAASLGAQMLTIHLCGGPEMIRAAVEAGEKRLTIVGVTVLTSANNETLRQIGIADQVEERVQKLATLGVQSGVNALVASPLEVGSLRKRFGADLKLIIPGVRPTWSEPGDQKRVMTPRQALEAGADYLVIGRPITAHSDPDEAVAKILEEIEA